ncbi:hypothetical protein GGS20DRAFT_590706 [Poronia punctata]|nr:hypothetical protein GGS20DRAFT_590706 [Poronia punctata]
MPAALRCLLARVSARPPASQTYPPPRALNIRPLKRSMANGTVIDLPDLYDFRVHDAMCSHAWRLRAQNQSPSLGPWRNPNCLGSDAWRELRLIEMLPHVVEQTIDGQKGRSLDEAKVYGRGRSKVGSRDQPGGPLRPGDAISRSASPPSPVGFETGHVPREAAETT